MNHFYKLCPELKIKSMRTMIQMNEKIKDEKIHFDFIKDEFSTSDAQEIIEELIHKKINFYKLKSLSNDIQFGQLDKNAQDRIKELETFKKSIEEQIQIAEKQFKSLKITSQINIEFI